MVKVKSENSLQNKICKMYDGIWVGCLQQAVILRLNGADYILLNVDLKLGFTHRFTLKTGIYTKSNLSKSNTYSMALHNSVMSLFCRYSPH